VALLVSFILKQDPDVHEYEEKLGRMQLVQVSDFDDRCLSGGIGPQQSRLTGQHFMHVLRSVT